MLKNKKRQFKKSEEGMALIETIPVLFMLVLVFNFSLGFFGAIHSGILNSIGSYNYTIETFRFRSNLMYLRPGNDSLTGNFSLANNRVHGTTREGGEGITSEDKTRWPATQRSITFNFVAGDAKKGLVSAINELGSDSTRNYGGRDQTNNIWHAKSEYTPEEGDTVQTPRIWIKTVYGICLNADCGD